MSTDLDELIALEEGLWRAETRFDLAWVKRVLAPDFFEFGWSGRIYAREQTLAVPAQPIHASLPLVDRKIRLLAHGVAQITYVSEVLYGGELQRGNRSSIWTRTDEGWKLRFHQGTAVHG